MRQVFCTFIFLLVLSGCAGQRPPEGGPPDSIPPEIISVYPAPNTVSFSDSKIIIEFSEYVDRRSTEGAIFISPTIEEKEFDWSGTELEITFKEELRKNTTYVVTVGTDVVDVRAQNRMAKAFTLAFSTGAKIDKGTVAGKVYDEKPDGVMIFSYRLDNILPDTLNPATLKPDYLTQTGKSGDFLLTNLAPGKYRIFALRDEFRNLLYDPETDAAGTTDDVLLTETDTLSSGLKFIIAQEDTTPPRLSSVTATDNRHLLVQFSEPLDSSSITAGDFSVTDTLFQNSVPVRQFFVNNNQYTSFTIVTVKQKGDQLYLLQVNAVSDRSEFVINPLARAKQFTGSPVNDTIPPMVMSSTLKESSFKIFPDDEITIQFNDVLLHPISDTTVTLKRQKDSSSIPLRMLRGAENALTFIPTSKLNIGEQYQLVIKWNGISDMFGNHLKDSIDRIPFTIEDPENYGSIEGIFAGFGGSANVIQAKNINDTKLQEKRTVATPSGKFTLNRLPEGRYALKAFDDRNGNFIHDAGKAFPYKRGERFSLYQDTIRVRARWPIDGVIFKVK